MDEVGRYAYNGGGEGNGKPGCDTSHGTNKVGSYLPNTWGLYDMHGNVNEWCLDKYGGGNYLPEPVTDPKGNYVSLYRAARGGGCFSSASLCRSACRDWYGSSSWSAGYGFRLVKMVP